jgi:hypothetical protein
MPRDCTALPDYDRVLVMNSPVSCLPDPIQNMVKITVDGQVLKKIANLPKKKKNIMKANMNNPLTRQVMLSAASGLTDPRSYRAAPTAYGAVSGQKKVFPLQAGSGSTLIVQNYELVHAQNGSAGVFSAGGDVMNPGLPSSYPWLSGIAKQYTRFRWKALRYIYVPTCSTTTAGSVFFYPSYDSYDSGPTSLAQVAVSENSCIGNAWFGGSINPNLAFKPLTTQESIFVNVDMNRFPNKWFYVRDTFGGTAPTSGGALGGVIPAGLTFTAGTMYDLESRPGIMYYGADGVAGAGSIGNLFAAYVVEFSDPIDPTLQI